PTASTAFLPPGTAPKFPSPRQDLIPAQLRGFRARVTGSAVFHARANATAHSLGRGNTIRADQGQTITIGSIAPTGKALTIHNSSGGLTIGQNFVAGNSVVIVGTAKVVIGDNVSIGDGAVVDTTSLGTGTTVGARSYLQNSSFPANSNIPPGSIYIN